MAKIKVELEAFHGYGCSGQSYSSNKTIEVEFSDKELEALHKLGSNEISSEAVVAAVEGGETALEELNDRLEEEFYYMIEEYWLFEAYNDCLSDSLSDAIVKDIEDGLYPPVSFENFVKWLDCAYIDDSGFLNDLTIEYYCPDDLDELKVSYDDYIREKYYDWICNNDFDHEFIANRVGLDLDACRDYVVNYTICLNK
jgi:hypothetical protein